MAAMRLVSPTMGRLLQSLCGGRSTALVYYCWPLSSTLDRALVVGCGVAMTISRQNRKNLVRGCHAVCVMVPDRCGEGKVLSPASGV
jgi:hypothetical protein